METCNYKLWNRIRNRARRDLCRFFARRPFNIALSRPLISFTFDDFPHSAWSNGGRILEEHAATGTFYASLELMGRDLDAGPAFQAADLASLLARGHELGCHTYSHCPSWETLPADLERAILDNRKALEKLLPGAGFRTLSWPINSPRPATKHRAGRYFDACRGGGQGFNAGLVDLNYLNSFFIEQSRDQPAFIKELIARNRAANGWLIFSTHDVCDQPTRLGCTPELFAEIVYCAIASGAEVLAVDRALEKIGVRNQYQTNAGTLLRTHPSPRPSP
jgi:peptidoglycan/xylan/chitin deacetylase (PgdA/CDA1 family)